MIRTVRRCVAALALGPALAFGAAVAAPTAASANAPGDISGCWSWSVQNGCTQWAECTGYGSNYICFVTENFYGFQYTYVMSG